MRTHSMNNLSLLVHKIDAGMQYYTIYFCAFCTLCTSAPPSKNAVSAFQITLQATFFHLGRLQTISALT